MKIFSRSEYTNVANIIFGLFIELLILSKSFAINCVECRYCHDKKQYPINRNSSDFPEDKYVDPKCGVSQFQI